ncbi:MAG: hypothetical protein AB7F65_10035 [Dehalococcoidia bacterium]
MRRYTILVLLVAAVAALGVTSAPAQAAEGDPGDFCSFSPDYPFGWSFNDACRGHDECLDGVSGSALPDRLDCDDGFLDALLDSPHLTLQGVCAESRFCSFLATLYHRVVRTVTLLSAGSSDLGRPAGAG